MESIRTAAAEGLASCHMCGRVSPVKARGRQRARNNSSAGVNVRAATTVITSPKATLGPVLEKSLKLVRPISDRPTIVVKALVIRARATRPSVVRIAPRGLDAFQFSPNRQDSRRQKSVPQPNRITTRNSSTSGDMLQPAWVIQASTPREISSPTPMVRIGTSASSGER